MSVGSELRVLAAGLLLGRLVLRKPATPAPEPVTVRITEPASKPRRKWLGLTQNSLVTAVISVVLSGVVSYLVAHQQSEDSARQAVTGQQIQQVIQLEADLKTYYNAVRLASYNYDNCMALKKKWLTCINGNEVNLVTAATDTQAPLVIDLDNISNLPLRKEAQNFINTSWRDFGGDLNRQNVDWDKPTTEYDAIIVRCGRLIQGQV